MGWKGPQGSQSSNPPPHTGPPPSTFQTSPGCPGPHPTWPSTPPRMDGASTASLGSCSAPPHSLCQQLPPHIQPQSALLQLHTISPCPALISPLKELMGTDSSCRAAGQHRARPATHRPSPEEDLTSKSPEGGKPDSLLHPMLSARAALLPALSCQGFPSSYTATDRKL